MSNKRVLYNLRLMIKKNERTNKRMLELVDELSEEKEVAAGVVVKPARQYRVINSFVWDGVSRKIGETIKLTSGEVAKNGLFPNYVELIE